MPDPRQATVEVVVATDPHRLFERAAEGFLAPREPAGASATRGPGAIAPGSAAPPFPSPRYLLALRQGGLRDDLIRLAAARGIPGWLDPPLCTFAELPARLAQTALEPCDDFERSVILGGVLRGHSGDVFGRRHRPQDYIDALDQLFRELVSEGVTAPPFGAALERRAGRDAFERERDHELAVIYAEYLWQLAKPDPKTGRIRRDGRDGLLDCAAAIAADPAALAQRLGGRRELRLFGLQDLRGGWRTLLRTLQQSGALDRIAIYTAEPLDLGDGFDPAPVVIRLEEPESVATRLFASPAARAGSTPAAERPEHAAAPSAAPISVIAAPDAEREAEEVARRVRALADAGVPLTRIAVVARQARPYADLVLAALDRFGVPATARRRLSLHEVPVVRAVRALISAAAQGWSRHALAELAEQPYFECRLDAQMINFAGFRRRISDLFSWRSALNNLAREAEADEQRRAGANGDDGERRIPLPPASRASAAAASFAAFYQHARELDKTRTLADWVAWLKQFLADDLWGIERCMRRVPGERWDVVRVDQAGWKWLTTMVDRWGKALDRWGGAAAPLDAREFFEQLEDLLDGDVALWTEMQRGVQVLEAFAAAYRSFDHVFIVGLAGGAMPLPLPASAILHEHERDALCTQGLPLEPRTTWDHRERELFRILVAGANRLTVSYPAVDAAARETVRSPFIDALGDVAALSGAGDAERIPSSRVVTPGVRLYADDAALARGRAAARIEWERAGGLLTPWNGRIEDPALVGHLAQALGDDRIWSPTQLESFAKCPWAYFSARLLRLEKLEDPDEEMDNATRGSLLHDALRRFYAKARDKDGKPPFLRTADLDWALPLAKDALRETMEDARGRRWLGNEKLLPAKTAELWRILRRFVAWEAEQHEDMYNNRMKVSGSIRTAPDAHELPFDDIVLDRNGVRFHFRGFIDRVGVGVDERFDASGFVAAVDYKTTKGAAPGGGEKKAWADDVVLQVPLYAYALSQLEPDKTVARVEYRALKTPEAVHSLELYRYDRKAKQVVENPEAVAQLERALDAVSEHVLRARSGEFPAAPAESCGCPFFCHALEICRVAGGPKVEKHFS
ncbi:MAG TPA: PD-(D/E)XK nuclease family protein [Gemmatimonadales bacterium]|nr:PD-(D/E)XK nuclease family protein [Gemmatimonadales bacterium]